MKITKKIWRFSISNSLPLSDSVSGLGTDLRPHADRADGADTSVLINLKLHPIKNVLRHV